MAVIYVKTKEGRALFYEGKPIPHDRFIQVNDDPFIRRLIDHWGDLEVGSGPTEAPAKPAAAGRGATPKVAAGPAAPAPRPQARPPVQTQAQPQPPAPGTGAPKPQN